MSAAMISNRTETARIHPPKPFILASRNRPGGRVSC
jgi:hypothetical protein